MNAIEKINRNKALVLFARDFYIFSPSHFGTWEWGNVEKFAQNFSRYTFRTMYYAENFIKNLEVVKLDLSERYDIMKNEFITLISDDLFFDFDAFVFSSKSIVEGNTVNVKKHLHKDLQQEFSDYSKFVFNYFIKDYLAPIHRY